MKLLITRLFARYYYILLPCDVEWPWVESMSVPCHLGLASKFSIEFAQQMAPQREGVTRPLICWKWLKAGSLSKCSKLMTLESGDVTSSQADRPNLSNCALRLQRIKKTVISGRIFAAETMKLNKLRLYARIQAGSRVSHESDIHESIVVEFLIIFRIIW